MVLYLSRRCFYYKNILAFFFLFLNHAVQIKPRTNKTFTHLWYGYIVLARPRTLGNGPLDYHIIILYKLRLQWDFALICVKKIFELKTFPSTPPRGKYTSLSDLPPALENHDDQLFEARVTEHCGGNTLLFPRSNEYPSQPQN